MKWKDAYHLPAWWREKVNMRVKPAADEKNGVKSRPVLTGISVGGIKGSNVMQDLIKEFIAQKKFAVIGATDNPQKYGNQIVKNLKSRGYEVFPVNPKLKELEGLTCYAALGDIPVKVDVVDFVVPPGVTEEILKQCKELGLSRIWLQPGSESETAIKFCIDNNLKVVHSVCVMMN